MHQGYQDLTFRRGASGALSLRLWCGMGLALAIGVWTSPEAWALTVSPTAMSFQAVQGATNPPSQTVNVSKSNNRTTSWAATDNATWLTVSPGIGTITSTAQVAVAVNTTGLAAGTYTATVTITVYKGGSTSVPVTLTVAPAATTSSLTTTTSTSSSTSASLTWAADTSTGLAGYKVYMGTASGVYGTSLNVGNVTSYVVSNLAVGTTYYFVVTAYNTSGSESPPSNEVSKSIY
jgi:fibronectin type III domain protein/BACON domain-containing protein